MRIIHSKQVQTRKQKNYLLQKKTKRKCGTTAPKKSRRLVVNIKLQIWKTSQIKLGLGKLHSEKLKFPYIASTT